MTQTYTLAVRSQIEERQLRRLGAAVVLLWEKVSPETRDALLAQASAIHISGETTTAEVIRDGIANLLESGIRSA